MWNPAITAANVTGNFNITLHPQSGTPITFTRPARVLEAGMIYQMPMQAVTVGEQSGTLLEHTVATADFGGTVSFSFETAGITNGSYALSTASFTNLPVGVIYPHSTILVNNNIGTIQLHGTVDTNRGTYSGLRVTIDGVQSNEFTLVITRSRWHGSATIYYKQRAKAA
jgi:dUTPase